ncbi:substrate-binding domain-containing protein [bacterium]|nr:substrate-binding domain-containing protein [bacterium]
MRKLGIVLAGLAVVALAAWIAGMGSWPTRRLVTLRGFVGGEKMELLEDTAVKRLLARRYGLVLDCTKSGSMEMIGGQMPADVDFLWPSSQLALALYGRHQSAAPVKSEPVLYSPVVLYAWDRAARALVSAGFVSEHNGVFQVDGFAGLIRSAMDGRRWSELGLMDSTTLSPIVLPVAPVSTDPVKSNSGSMYTGLLANVFAGRVCRDQDVKAVLPRVKAYFEKLGYLERTTSDLFERFLVTGLGALPVIVGYESQIIGYAKKHSLRRPEINRRIRVLYPVPTVWSAHPLMVLRPEAEILLQAMQDPDFQEIAWEKHGFRTGMMGIQNHLSDLPVRGIPETIARVIPMPAASVMDTLIKALALHH